VKGQDGPGMARPSLCAAHANRLIRQGAEPVLVMVQATHEPAASVHKSWHERLPDMSALNADEKQAVLDLLDKYKSIFPETIPAGLPPNTLPCRVIPLEEPHKIPFRQRGRLSPVEMKELEKQVGDLLERGLIEPSSSPYGAPVLFVPKADGSLRACFDYRELNEITIKNRFPIPMISDIIDQFQGASVFSSLDLTAAYNQFKLMDEYVHASAFTTPFGHFQWRVLSFGLTNAPSVLCREMLSRGMA
jgi:hypothetical protein